MNRIKSLLLFAHLLWVFGGLAYYVSFSWIWLVFIVLGFWMRWMAPIEKEKKEQESKFEGLFFGLWMGLLLAWLLPIGLSEVIEQAIEDRLSVIPVILFLSILLQLPVRDWLHLRSLRPEDIDRYYSTKSNA